MPAYCLNCRQQIVPQRGPFNWLAFVIVAGLPTALLAAASRHPRADTLAIVFAFFAVLYLVYHFAMKRKSYCPVCRDTRIERYPPGWEPNPELDATR